MAPYRGRLIWPFTADVRRLDGAATAAVDPPGALATVGVNPIFGEPYTVQETPGGPTTTTRTEREPIYLPCQIEVPDFGDQNMKPQGSDETRTILCVFHFADLETLGLVGANGRALINPSDRLAAIYDKAGVLVEEFDDVQMFCTKAEPRSFGLSGLARNLLVCTFEDRSSG